MRPAKDFGGVSILMVTPLDREGRFCAEDFASLVKFVSSPTADGQSIGGLTVCGEMGEGFSLTDSDKSSVIAAAKSLLSKDKVVIAALFSLSVRDAMEQAELCAKAGADALLAAPVAPFLYSGRALRLFFEKIGEASGLPVIAYVNKMFKASLPPPEVVREVFETSCVIGVKDSTGDLAFIGGLLAARPAGKIMIHTVSSSALAGVRAGADGLMVGTSNIAPQAALELWVHGRGKSPESQDRAQKAQDRLNAAVKLYQIASLPGTSSKDWVVVKEALAQMGVIREPSKFPALPYEALAPDDQRRVSELLAGLSRR